MATRHFVDELEYGSAKGVDTTSPLSMVQPGFLRDARNANIGVTGGYFKRDGYSTQLSTKWTGTSDDLSIRQGIEFQPPSGSTQLVLYGTDDSGDGRVGKEDAGGVIDIQTGLSATDRLAFIQFEDRLFWFNGDSTNSPKVYEGVSPRDLGLSAPAAAPTVAVVGSGGSLEIGEYTVSYMYIIRDSVTKQVIAKSSPSATQSASVTVVDSKLQVTVVASGASVSGTRELVIYIYRTGPGGDILFLDPGDDGAGAYADADDTYELTVADASLLPNQMELDNSQLGGFDGYDKAKFPTVARNRLFVAHETRNEVRFSKVSYEGPLPESFPAVNFATVEGRYGLDDPIVGLGNISGLPIVLKQHSIGRLEEVGLPEISISEDLVTYIYREISDTVGAVSHFAQAQVFSELLFLGRDNIYATNGQVIRPIGSAIQATIKAFDFQVGDKDQKVSMINDTKNRRVYITAYELTTSPQPDWVIVGDYQQYPDFRWTFYTPGTDTSSHPGLQAGSLFQLRNATDGSYEVFFGNTLNNGQYYQMQDGENDDGDGIYFKITSRPYDMQQPIITKLFKNIRLFAEAADNSYDFTVCSIYDLSGEEVGCETFTVVGTGNNWDEHNWADDADPLVWAGSALAELEYNPHRKGKFLQVVIKQTDADAPATILGWGVSGSIFGGK